MNSVKEFHRDLKPAALAASPPGGPGPKMPGPRPPRTGTHAAMTDQPDAVAHVIQLSVAPVFLLTGIGALLGVMTNRLSRIVDRARVLEPHIEGTPDPSAHPLHGELRTLGRRARLVNLAITLFVFAALVLCGVIVGLFVTAYYAWSPDLTRIMAALFALAMTSLIGGLLCFLREVYLATATLRIGVR
jgi:hypothetical protein